jgi:hypothetical protein
MSRTPLFARVVAPLTELVRWGEPWDVEDEPDPLLEGAGASAGDPPLVASPS